MKEFILKAQERTETKTKSSRRSLRREGIVPGVFYSKTQTPINIAAPELQVNKLVFTSESHLVNLAIENKGDFKCVMKDFQIDPVTDRVIHFDLLGFASDEKITVEVPVVLAGQAAGVKEGGILQHMLHKVEVECLAADLPEHIEVNVKDLKVGDAVHAGDIKVNGVKVLNSKDAVVVSVVVAKEASTEASETAEPEVIAKGKKEA